MPTASFPLAVVITGVDRLSGTLGHAESKIGTFGKKAMAAGAAMTFGVTIPALGMLTAISRTAIGFEQELLRFKAATFATDEQMADMDKLARSFSKLGFGATETAQAMTMLGKAGVEAANMTKVLQPVLNAARTSGLDLAQVADDVINVITGYGLSIEDAARVTSVLQVAADKTTNNWSDMVEAFRLPGPILAAMNHDFEGSAAALALLGQASLKGELAGTSVRYVMADLANVTHNAAKELHKLKIEPKDFFSSAGYVKDMIGLVEALEKSMVTPIDMMRLFGKRAGPGMLALTKIGSKGMKEFRQALVDLGDAGLKKVDILMSGTEGSLKRFTAQVELLQIAIGRSGLLGWLASGAEKLGAFAQKLEHVSPGLLSFGTGATIAAAAAGPLIFSIGATAWTLGKMAPALSKVGGLLRTVWVGFGLAGGAAAGFESAAAAAIAPIVLIGAGLAEIAGETYLIIKYWDKLTGLWNTTFGWIAKRALKPFTNILGPGDVSFEMFGESPETKIAKARLAGTYRSERPSVAKSQVTVEFKNAPPGMRVSAPKGDADVDLDVGYALASP